ncbi:MAG: fumarylacetoacetate hydrolase family protein, partial [Acidimicrobiales bacterium]
ASARAGRGMPVDPGWYERPVFYFSNPAAIAGPGAVVVPPPRCRQLDFELEFGWLVGEQLRGADLAAATRAIVGYTVLNDWSARDVQREEMRMGLGPAKGKDFATTAGPVLVTADEFDPARGGMQARVDGRPYGRADRSECYWSPAEMTAFAAEAAVVRPGDLFGSGAAGTGCILELSLTHGIERFPWLVPGAVVELEIDGIGTLVNTVGPPGEGGAWQPEPGRARPAR